MENGINIRDFADKVCEVKDKVIKIQEHIINMASEMKVECEIDNNVYLNNEDKLNYVVISVESDVEEFLLFIKNYTNQWAIELESNGVSGFRVEMLEEKLFLTIKIL